MSINKSALTKSIQDRGNYTTLPNDIWSTPISTKAKIVYIYLLSNREKWAPGTREIASATAIGRDSVKAAIQELEAHSMILVDRPEQAGLRITYVFTAIENWLTIPKVESTTLPILTSIIEPSYYDYNDPNLLADL